MTKFKEKTFTVPTGKRKPDTCTHGWRDSRGRCVFCGALTTDKGQEGGQ